MKLVSWFVQSHIFVGGVEDIGNSVCWLLRKKFMYNSCSGYVTSSVPAITSSLSAFLLSPEYSCELHFGSCINHEWYTPVTTQQYIDKIMLHKPEYLKKDNFLDYIYSEINNSTAPRKTLSMI